MTTIASGFWISEPGPLANSSGTRPKAAMLAVISTGRRRRFAPSTHDLVDRHAARVQLVEVGHHHHAVEHRDAEQGDEADRGRHRQVLAARPTARTTPPIIANGMLANTSTACRTEPKVANSSRKISPSAIGTTSGRRAAARCWFSNWPPQVDAVALRQLHLSRPRLALASSTKPTRSRPRDVGLHHGVALARSRGRPSPGRRRARACATWTAARCRRRAAACAARRTAPGESRSCVRRRAATAACAARLRCTMPTLRAFELAAQVVLRCRRH